MKEAVEENGRRYLEITEEERKSLPPLTRVYYIGDDIKGIAPPDCKHNFEVSGGCPRNIKYCTKCVYWEFTNEPPTSDQ